MCGTSVSLGNPSVSCENTEDQRKSLVVFRLLSPDWRIIFEQAFIREGQNDPRPVAPGLKVPVNPVTPLTVTLVDDTIRSMTIVEPSIQVPSADRDAAFAAIVARLSRQSVAKHFDAYEDVPWDEPGYAIDPDDPRWRLPAFDALGQTDWYRSQPESVQSRVALHRIATCMRVGWEFENVLQRGLLSYAMRLPNGAPEFRYLHHEVVEESQHTMMFQEFVN